MDLTDIDPIWAALIIGIPTALYVQRIPNIDPVLLGATLAVLYVVFRLTDE
jgi:hypothetical protein